MIPGEVRRPRQPRWTSVRALSAALTSAWIVAILFKVAAVVCHECVGLNELVNVLRPAGLLSKKTRDELGKIYCKSRATKSAFPPRATWFKFKVYPLQVATCILDCRHFFLR